MIKEGAIPIWAKLLLNKMIVWKLNSYWDKRAIEMRKIKIKD